MAISVVILNFNRPDYIKNNIIPELDKINLIDEIIISHGKEKTFFKSTSEKVKNLKHWGEANEIYGLTLRFVSAQEAKNEAVIIMDDDIIPYENTIKVLYELYEKEKDRIYGLYGRYLDENNKYSKENVFGQVPIILTRFLLTHRDLTRYFLTKFRDLENDLIKNSKPYWNGEDILFSLLSIEKYGKLPQAINLNHHNRISNYLTLDEAISTGASNHDQYRKKLSQYLVKELDLENKIITDTNIEKRKNQFSYFFFNSILFYLFIIVFIFITFYFFRYYYFKKTNI